MTAISNEPAYAVLVRLNVLASRLARHNREPCDELAAARWLTMGKSFGKHFSPFAQTDEWGVFYSDVDPRDFLAVNEIKKVHVTDKRYRDEVGNLMPI